MRKPRVKLLISRSQLSFLVPIRLWMFRRRLLIFCKFQLLKIMVSIWGCLLLLEKNKKAIFSFIKDKVWLRFQGWRKKLLSKAGKEVLLKTVVHSIPSYVMSVFLIPLCLCEELERMMNSFWWGKNGRVHDGIKWKSWDKLCHHKVTGGLGFRRLHEFNLAMLGKLGCRLLQEPHSLVAKVFKARYYPFSFFWRQS